MLTQHQAVDFLLERRLLRPAQVVAGSLVVEDISRRNCNFRVLADPGPSYLIKQGPEPAGYGTLHHEALVYRVLEPHYGQHMPRLHGYDAGHRALTLEYLPGSETVRDARRRSHAASTRVASTLGAALAELHELPTETAFLAKALHPEATPAWGSSIHRPWLSMLAGMSEGNLAMIELVQGDRQFGWLLDEVRGDWRDDAVIHGDLRWDNLLLCPPPDGTRRTRLKLIDWELARVGDAAWDVGAVFGDHLQDWVNTIPPLAEATPSELAALARHPIDHAHRATQSFWDRYRRARSLGVTTSTLMLHRAVRFAAVRLVQGAYEQAQSKSRLTSSMVLMLQLSFNMLVRPLEAATALLGIRDQ
jgi:aminoglycoside phosphotransferase (APT) family kinase protein